MKGLVQLGACGDVVVQHQKMEFFFSFFMMHGGNQHTAGLDAHHGSGGQIGDGHAGLANQLFRLVIGVDSAQNGALVARSVVQSEL